MKKLIAVLMIAAIAAAFAGCDDSSPAGASGVTKVIYAFAYHGDTFGKRDLATDLWGIIAADPFPIFESVTMNGTEFAGSDYW